MAYHGLLQRTIGASPRLQLAMLPQTLGLRTATQMLKSASIIPAPAHDGPRHDLFSIIGSAIGCAALLALTADEDPSHCAPEAKRTKKHHFDSVAPGMYEVEQIVAEATSKGKTTFQIKWKGYSSKDNTWEPMANLVGPEDMIAAFREEKHAEQMAVLEKIRADKEARKVSIERTARLGELPAAGTRTAPPASSDAAGAGPSVAAEREVVDISGESQAVQRKHKRLPPRALVYQVFDPVEGEERKYKCKLCGEEIKHCGGTKGMWNHLMYSHKSKFLELKNFHEDSVLAHGIKDEGQTVITVPKLSAVRKEDCDLAVAR